MFTNNIPFGFSNNCGPVGCTPFNSVPFAGVPFYGFSGYNGWCGDNCAPINCSPVSGWNASPYAGLNTPNYIPGVNTPSFLGGVNTPSYIPGVNTPSFLGGLNTPYAGLNGINALNSFGCVPGYPIPSYNLANGYSNCSPIGANWSQQVAGLNSWNSVPFAGLGHQNWNTLGLNSQFTHPLSCNVPFNGMHQGVGFPGTSLSNASIGYNTPWMNWAGCSPVNAASPFIGASPITGVSNWFNSPWMSPAYAGYNQQHNVVANGKTHLTSPINGQYIPSAAVPFSCSPFSVPFPTTGYAPINGYVPAGQGVNCEAA